MTHMERIDVFCSIADLSQLIKSHPHFIQTLFFPLAWLMTEIITVYTIYQDEIRMRVNFSCFQSSPPERDKCYYT